MNEIMEGAATPAQIAGFGVALRVKGETVAGADRAGPRDARATPRRSTCPGRLTDLVGTGGDGAHTVNISTMGDDRRGRGGRADGQARQPGRVVVLRRRRRPGGARRGDRPAARRRLPSWPPRSGSRSVRAAVPPGAPARGADPQRARRADRVQLPRAAGQPGAPVGSAVGVADPRMGDVIAGVLAGRGCSALVFRGDDGLDELTTTAPSTVWVVPTASVAQTRVRPGRRWASRRASVAGPARRRRRAQRRGRARRAGRRAGPGAGHRAAERGCRTGRGGRRCPDRTR